VSSNLRVNLKWIESEHMITDKLESELASVDGILIPGGFGIRGVAGMIEAVRYARENKVPYLGICLGLQCAVIEAARNLCGLSSADSTEFDENTPHRVIYKLRDLLGVEDMGGTMRLGAYPAELAEGSFARKAYGRPHISERHRHRYEVNQEYLDQLKQAGLRITGLSPDGKFVEIVEYADHPWFLACQYHPEYKSRPLDPHPLFREFVAASYRHRKARREAGQVDAADAYTTDRNR
jgi:CTP synthase